MIAATLALALLAAPVSADVTIRGEASGDGSQTVATVGVLRLIGTAGLSWAGPALRLGLNYSATGRVYSDASTALLHLVGGAGSLRLRPAGTDTITLSQSANYGQRDYSLQGRLLSGQPTPPLDRLPGAAVVEVFNLASRAAWTHAFSGAWNSTTAAEFTTGGGLGHEGRAALALQRTGSLSAASTMVVAGRNRVTLTLAGTLGRSSTGQESRLGGLGAGWALALDGSTSVGAGLGIGAIANLPAPTAGTTPALQTSAFPTASLNFTHSLRAGRGPLRLALTASADPAIDPLSGAGYLRGTARASAAWSPALRFTLTAAGSGAKAFTNLSPHDWGAQTEVSAAWRPLPPFGLSAGLRWGWTPLISAPASAGAPLPPLTGGAQWSVYCAADLLQHASL